MQVVKIAAYDKVLKHQKVLLQHYAENFRFGNNEKSFLSTAVLKLKTQR